MKDNADPNIPPIVDRGSTSYTYNDAGVATTQWVLKTGRIVIENVPERTLTLNGKTYYDGMGRTYLATADGPDGKTSAVQIQFDNVGRVWKQSNPYYLGDTPYFTEFTYDGFSRLTDTLKTDLYQIDTYYEGLRKVVSKQVTATDWQSKAYTYDLNQRLVEVKEGFELQGAETTTTYAYNVLGNLTQVIAANSGSGCPPEGCPEKNTTTMTYDSLMKKKTMTDPDMGYWTYAYDNAGNLTTQTDAKGQTISLEYNDGLNRLTQKTYVSSNPAERVVYSYDDPAVPHSKGKLTKVSRLVGSNPEVEVAADSVLEYDLMQRVKASKKKIETNEKTFYKDYDSAGRAISITYPGNKIYSYAYDVAGDLLYVNDNASGSNLVEYSDFTALGQPKIANSPKPNNVSVRTTYTYDPPTARLKTLITQKLVSGTPTETYQNLDYQQFDGVGNIKILADIFNNITHNYTYDHLNRLTLASGVGTNAYTQSYQYDRIGNIAYKSDVGYYNYTYGTRPHAVNYTYNGLININLQYDANGNMTQRASGGITLDITYNYDNKPGLINKNSVNYVQFTYDGNGQRVKKYNYATGQSVLYFGDLYEIRGGVETIHVFAGNQRIASVLPDGTTQFYHKNHLGSSSVVTDQYGARKEQIEYYPFGTYRNVGNINGTYDFDPNFPDVFYTFTGQEDDDDLGLYNYGARLYDPVLGKFISADSIVQAPDDPQMLNRCSYARNNPLIYTDPTGQFLPEILNFIAGILTPIIGASAAAVAAPLIVTAAGGAALGVAQSALTGDDIGFGALTGAITAVTFFAAGMALDSITAGMSELDKVAVRTIVDSVAAAISSAINNAITGSNIGLGVVNGAVSAGMSTLVGGVLPKGEEIQIIGRVVAGGIAGGTVSELYGGNFWKGFVQGAGTAAAAFLFNEGHKRLWMVLQASGEFAIGKGLGVSGTLFLRADEPSNAYASVDENTGLGVGKALPGGGFVYTDNPDKVSGSLNICYGGCISVFFQGWWPVGAVGSAGGAGVWWSEPLWSISGEWR